MVVACGWLSAMALSVATLCYEFDGLLSLLPR